jgi:hypothetical protein
MLALEMQRRSSLTEAMGAVASRLEGAFTLVAVSPDAPDTVVAARRNSPLVVGLGQGENFLASDVAAFIEHTREALELGQDQIVVLTPDGVTVTDFEGNPSQARPYHVDWDLSAAETNLGASVGVDNSIGLAGNRRAVGVADRDDLGMLLTSMSDGHESIGRLTRLGNCHDERHRVDDRLVRPW